MRPREIQDALHRLREEKFRLEAEYEENGGEVTDSTLSREQAIADIKTLLLSREGVDSLGRLIRSNTDDIQGYKPPAPRTLRTYPALLSRFITCSKYLIVTP